ncbi:MAG: hypothetical protein ACO3I0_13685 [Limisphaerales bacterium]
MMVHGILQFLSGRRLVGRAGFMAVALALVLVRLNLERIVFSGQGYNPPQSIVTILNNFAFGLIPIPEPVGLSDDWLRWLSLIPFLWVGACLALGRLQHAQIPRRWALLFLIPGVRVLFFLILGALPGGDATSSPKPRVGERGSFLDRWLPSSRWGCALASAIYAGAVGVGLTLLSTQVFGEYGWALFVVMPFALGAVSTGLYLRRHPATLKEAQWVSFLSVFCVGGLLFGLALEGLLCLFMATPIALLLAAMGGSFVWQIQKANANRSNAPLMGVVFLSLPALFAGEPLGRPANPTFTVQSEVFVAASPQRLWPLVVDVAELPPDGQLWSRLGMATFRRAWTEGEGVGAIRYCEFDTGLAREPVEIWDPPRRLQLRVETTPTPLKELSLYEHIHAPHLRGFYEVNSAEFLLEPVEGGTRLIGTTRYQHGLWPAQYWAWWCGHVVKDLQQRVLTHAKRRAEARP